jgi:hypothetical protein
LKKKNDDEGSPHSVESMGRERMRNDTERMLPDGDEH